MMNAWLVGGLEASLLACLIDDDDDGDNDGEDDDDDCHE
jgi:hypothetical protein